MKVKLISNIGRKLSAVGGKTLLKGKQYSPEILMVTGIVSLVGSGVMAAKATLKVEGVLDEHSEKMNKIEEVYSDEEYTEEEYSEEDYKRDKVVIYAQTATRFVGLYGPSVALAAVGVACILGGNKILRKRNIALVGAYKALEKSYFDYRKRVVEDQGEDKDLEYSTGGKVEVSKEGVRSVTGIDPNNLSPYAKFFDSSCSEWDKNPEYNLAFLKTKQTMWNDRLRMRGHVFLNEIYDDLGIKRTQAGAVVGWVISKEGDNYIDFGLYRADQKAIDFVNGYENVALLDFNVDGVIYDRI